MLAEYMQAILKCDMLLWLCDKIYFRLLMSLDW